MKENRFLKRIGKRAKKGARGYPVATIAFYGPNLSRATKVAVGIFHGENEAAREMRRWHLPEGDVRHDESIAQEMLAFIEEHGAPTVAMSERIIGCPHEEGVDYEGEWCPMCDFWRGRDRFTGKLLASDE
jgi:hypothetical protein